MNHPLIEMLVRLGISRREDFKAYYPRVRDRDDITVLRCARSGVIVLDRADHATVAHYANEQYSDAITAGGVTHDAAILDDAQARAGLYRHLVRGKRWLDVGTGPAAVLDAMAEDTQAVAAVEPNDALRRQAVERGYRIFPAISEVPSDETFDVATLFHVFEHLPEPLRTLGELRSVLTPGGLVLLEVPHARDFLLETLDSEPFRAFTLWSEHLILHTRESLRRCLEAAGFTDIVIQARQRYPVSNHLHWLRHGLPGGHTRWGFLESSQLAAAYEAALASIDQTDTLVALARHPQ